MTMRLRGGVEDGGRTSKGAIGGGGRGPRGSKRPESHGGQDRGTAAGVPLPVSPRLPLAIGALLAGAAALGAMFLVLMLMMLIGAGGVGSLGGIGGTPETVEATDAPSALATGRNPAGIPGDYEQAAGRRYGLDWAILAGIGKVECDHGRDPDPSCTQEGAVNSAGAGGPMQFLASTWAKYGVDAEGGGTPDRWNPADAIFGAANYLRASGAPGDYRKAIFAYNHAEWYVDEVESWAAKYRGSPTSPPAAPTRSRRRRRRWRRLRTAAWRGKPDADRVHPGRTGGARSRRTATWRWIPEGVPTTVQAMIVAGNELQELPYGPGGHPDPRGATEEDCSSTVNYVLYRSGVRPIAEIVRDNPLAQDYVELGRPRPGRWVTIYATDAPTAARVHRDRGAAAGHEPQRDRRGAEQKRKRPALADPGPHPDVGAMVGQAPAGVRCRRSTPTGSAAEVPSVQGWAKATRLQRLGARREGRLPADRRRTGERELRALAARGGRGGRGPARGPRARRAV